MPDSLIRRTTDRLLESPLVYGVWQAPFANAKLRPFLRRVDLGRLKRVLDVGCGPGTNAPLFGHVDYLGIDVNAAYIATATRRHGGRFAVGDVSDARVLPNERFDCIFINSLMHHLDDDTVSSLLSRVGRLCTADGSVHIIDLVMPERRSAASLLARLDRGRFARSEGRWHALFSEHLVQQHVELYSVGVPGLALWELIYFVGGPR
jgi:SAM-dependent methyltransferase